MYINRYYLHVIQENITQLKTSQPQFSPEIL